MGVAHGSGDLTPEDMRQHAHISQIRDNAIRWITAHQKEIDSVAGPEGAAVEKSLVQMVIMIETAAAMYTSLRKEHGHRAAQETLGNAISMISSLLRRNGEDVRMICRVDFVPLSAAPGGPDVAPAAAPPEECKCEVDQDGHCNLCIKMLENFTAAMSQSIVIIKESSLQGTMACRPCLRREMDPVMARFVKKDLSSMDPETAEAVMKSMFATSQGMQAMQMPLTTKAWDEVIQSRKSGDPE